MKEEFLHYIWRNKKINLFDLKTEQGQAIEILHFGTYLQSEGPDFFNAQLRIDEQLWAGNVEMHLNASDWYTHQHELDPNYDNVILHVVWNYDVDVFRKDGTLLPVLELSKWVSSELIASYEQLSLYKNWIYCENDIDQIDDFTWFQWKEKLLIARLELKAKPILELLAKSNNNWEEVLFMLLSKNFGLNINGAVFEETARLISFSIMQKSRTSVLSLEALLFGVSGLLTEPKEDLYFQHLLTEYAYLKVKFQITQQTSERPHFFKLRPDNFPTIRFSQLANLLHTKEHLFSDLIQTNQSLDALYLYFEVQVSDYWQTHFVFDEASKSAFKKLTKSFIDLVVINTILPLRFLYLKSIGKSDFDTILQHYESIKPEQNVIIDKFSNLGVRATSAFDTQSLIQLKKNYCDNKRCLECMVGLQLLKNNV